MSYLEVLLIFIFPPLLAVGYFYVKSHDHNKGRIGLGILILVGLAVLYTTPWDNYLIKTGVWSYSPDRVLGTIGYVPYEEYAFFVLQTLLTGLWFFYVQTKTQTIEFASVTLLNYFFRYLLIVLTFAGFYFLAVPELRYMGLILSWGCPVLLLQWIVGAGYLISNSKLFWKALVVPTLYLWCVDAIALHLKVWKISMTQTTGFGGILPIEEAIFFLITNIMVVQGLILFVVMKGKLKWASI